MSGRGRACDAAPRGNPLLGTGTAVLETSSAVTMVVLRMAVTGIVSGSRKIPYSCGRLNLEGELQRGLF